jgi:uncharacterized protein YecT (DUF1311 family)
MSNQVYIIGIFILTQFFTCVFCTARQADPFRIYEDAKWLYDHHFDDLNYPVEQIEKMFIKADDIFTKDRQFDKKFSQSYNCWRFHFGIGVHPNTQRAFNCAVRCGDRWLLAHYYTNGGPVIADPGMAIGFLLSFRNTPMNTKTYYDFKNYEFSETDAQAQIAQNRSRIDNIIMQVALGVKVDIASLCQSEATPSSRHSCEWKDLVLTEARLYWMHRNTYESLDAEGKRLFANYVNAFNGYRSWRTEYIRISKFDNDRQYNLYIAYQLNLLKSHEATISSLFTYKPIFTTDEFKKADVELNSEYQLAMNYYKHAEDYSNSRGYLRVAQRRWINYRDAEATLFSYINRSKFSPKAIATDVKARLSQERVTELAAENAKEDRYTKYQQAIKSPVANYADYVKSLPDDFQRNLRQILLLREKIRRKHVLMGMPYLDIKLEERYFFSRFPRQQDWDEEKELLRQDLDSINKFTDYVKRIFNDAGKVYNTEAFEKYEFTRAIQTGDKWLQAYYYLKGGTVAANKERAVTLLRQFAINPYMDENFVVDKHKIEEIINKIKASKTVDLINECPCSFGWDFWFAHWDDRYKIKRAWIFLVLQEMVDDAGKKLFLEYASSFQAFANAHARFWGREDRDGGDGYFGELTEQNTSALLSFLSYSPQTTPAELEIAESQLRTMYTKVYRNHEHEEDEMRVLQQLWIRYRDAEVAFFVHEKSNQFSPELIAAEVKTRLTLSLIDKWYYFF